MIALLSGGTAMVMTKANQAIASDSLLSLFLLIVFLIVVALRNYTQTGEKLNNLLLEPVWQRLG